MIVRQSEHHAKKGKLRSSVRRHASGADAGDAGDVTSVLSSQLRPGDLLKRALARRANGNGSTLAPDSARSHAGGLAARKATGSDDEPVLDNGDEPVLDNGDEPVLDNGDEPVLDNGDEPVLDEPEHEPISTVAVQKHRSLAGRKSSGRNAARKDGGDAAQQNADQAFYEGPKVAGKRKRRKGSSDSSIPLPDEMPKVFVPVYVSMKAHGGNAAILLSQLIYWNTPRKDGRPRLAPESGVLNAPRPWTPGYRGIEKQTGLRKGKALLAIRALVKMKLVKNGAQKGQPLRLFLPERFREKLLRKGLLTAVEPPRGVLVRVAEVAITKTGNQAIVLSAILPWFEPNQKGNSKLRISHDGRNWRANSYKQLSEETGLNVFKVKLAVKGLKDLKLIVTNSKHMFKGKRMLRVSLDVEALRRAWMRLENGKPPARQKECT